MSEAILHDLQWFKDRVFGIILRGTTEVEITSDEVAEKLFKLQSPTYTFTEKLRVHRPRPEECESCSA